MRSRNLLIIGTRGSELALKQAQYIKALVKRFRPELELELKIIKTKGDKILNVALSKIGDKGLFTKELELALLNEEIDCCVHSMKDVPTILPEGLMMASSPLREDARDVLLAANPAVTSVYDLPQGARVGTGSLRRQAQLRALRPDLELCEIRGNLDTRIRRMEEGECDALVLAAAGIHRMGWRDKIKAYFSLEEMLPAPGQGTIGIEIRADDLFTATVFDKIKHKPTFRASEAERSLMCELGCACDLPFAAYARMLDDTKTLKMTARVLSFDGTRCIEASGTADKKAGTFLALELRDKLQAAGAFELLEEMRTVAPKKQDLGEVIF